MVLVFVWAPTPAVAKDTGRIEGQLTRSDGGPLAHVTVSVNGTSAATVTDPEGHFVLKRIPVGTYTLTFTFLKKVATRSDVSVTAGSTTRVDQTVDWDMSLIETVVVYSASRREETIGEAPGAVTRVEAEEIELKSADGQVPKLLEFKPGVEINQVDVYNFNINSRGFNRTFTTRTQVLIDGRDVSSHNFGHQAWVSFSYGLDDIANMEYLRGPSSAIYGANASNGVVNLKTKEPRYDLGGRARLSLGELNTTHVDFRWSGSLGNNWYLRATGGSRNSESFLVSRAFSAEYAQLCSPTVTQGCLLQEVEPPLDKIRIHFGGLRLDKYLSSGSLLTLEVSTADFKGLAWLSSAGRFMPLDSKQRWGRVGYRSKHWELLGAVDTADGEAINLNGGFDSPTDTDRYQARVQTNWGFKDEKVQLVAGGAYRDTDTDYIDIATGKRGEIRNGYVFAQVDWTVSEHLKLLVAASYDDHSVHDSQVSPKAAVVYRINPAHTLRFTYNEGIRTGNALSLFSSFPVAPPLDLSGLQTGICDPAGVDCGLSAPVPVIIVGNNDIEHEENVTYEIGYTGIIANKTIITLDVYTTKFDKFFSPFIPQLGTPLGRLNSDFGEWEPPPGNGVPDPVRDAVRAAVPCLSNQYDGSTVCPVLSLTNLGKVETWGADLGLDHFLAKDWKLFLSYSWWGWEPQEEIAGLVRDLLYDPANPRHKVSAGVGYSHDRFDAGLQARWVDDFMQNNGLYIGPIESYTIADLNANYVLGNDWQIGANISNVFDNEHYQMFGGSLIGRRALAYVLYEF